jgi:Protein of unknown function (DUF3224)
MKNVARGSFTVSLKPLAFEGQESDSGLHRMSIDKDISGDLVATTRGQMLSALTTTAGSAGYVAVERVEGALHGRQGAFVLQHTGVMNRGQADLKIIVVPDSGSGELAGLEGDFEIQISGDDHFYVFSYNLP